MTYLLGCAAELRFKLWMNDGLIDSPRSDVWEDMVTRLGGAAALDASARRYGAFQRPRRVKSATDLLRLMLAYAPGGRSLRVTAAEAGAHGSPRFATCRCSSASGVVPTG